MSTRSARLILWLALVLIAPLPVLTGVVTGLMPTVRILMLAGICVGVMLLENPSGVVGTLAAMLVVQAALYAILLFGVAHVVSRLLGRLSPRGVAAVALALLATGVVLAASIDLYRTPFRVASARANVFEIFE